MIVNITQASGFASWQEAANFAASVSTQVLRDATHPPAEAKQEAAQQQHTLAPTPGHSARVQGDHAESTGAQGATGPNGAQLARRVDQRPSPTGEPAAGGEVTACAKVVSGEEEAESEGDADCSQSGQGGEDTAGTGVTAGAGSSATKDTQNWPSKVANLGTESSTCEDEDAASNSDSWSSTVAQNWAEPLFGEVEPISIGADTSRLESQQRKLGLTQLSTSLSLQAAEEVQRVGPEQYDLTPRHGDLSEQEVVKEVAKIIPTPPEEVVMATALAAEAAPAIDGPEKPKHNKRRRGKKQLKDAGHDGNSPGSSLHPIDDSGDEATEETVPAPLASEQTVVKQVPVTKTQEVEKQAPVPQVQTVGKVAAVPLKQPFGKIAHEPQVSVQAEENAAEVTVPAPQKSVQTVAKQEPETEAKEVDRQLPVPQVQTVGKVVKEPQNQPFEKAVPVPSVSVQELPAAVQAEAQDLAGASEVLAEWRAWASVERRTRQLLAEARGMIQTSRGTKQ